MSSRRNAAPVGVLRSRSQLAAVTVGMFIIAAKTGWLTLSFARIDRTCEGVSGLTRAPMPGSGRQLDLVDPPEIPRRD